MSIKTITFDLDGVYFPNGKAKFINALGEMGVSEDEAKRVFLKSDQMNLEYKNGRLSDEQYWIWAKEQWNVNLSWKDIIKLMIDGYSVDEKVAKIVKRLRNNGYKTAICSNNFPARINGLQKKFKFLDDFDVVVLSYKEGISKPDERIFDELVKKAGGDPSSVVFADDNQKNLEGARKIGVVALEYTTFENYIEQLRKLGVAI